MSTAQLPKTISQVYTFLTWAVIAFVQLFVEDVQAKPDLICSRIFRFHVQVPLYSTSGVSEGLANKKSK